MIRIKRVVAYMGEMAKGANGGGITIVMRIAMEMLDELSEVPAPLLEFYTKQIAAMLFWVSSGEINPDIPLPDNFTV